MKLFETNYKGETIVFETTNKARVEIKDTLFEGIKDISASEYSKFQIDAKNLEIESEKISQMPDGEEKQRLFELLEQKATELTDTAQKISTALEMAEISTIDFMYIILKNTRRYKGNLDREIYDDIIYEMEENLGDLETFKILEEARQKAFTQFEKMQKMEEKLKVQKKKSASSKAN